MPRRASHTADLHKSWIERVDEKAFSTNGEIIYCEVCECDLHVKKLTHLQQHSTSSKHLKNVLGKPNMTSISTRKTRAKTKAKTKKARAAKVKRETKKRKVKYCDDDEDEDEEEEEEEDDDDDDYAAEETIVKTEPTPPSCANCNHSLEGESCEIITELSLEREREGDVDDEEDDDLKKPEKSATIPEALELIYGFSFKSKAAVLKERLILCAPCGRHLADLYRLFCEFRDLCHEESYISTNKIQRNPASGSAILILQRKVASLQNKYEKLRLCRMKEQKKRLKLQSEKETKKTTPDAKIKIEKSNSDPTEFPIDIDKDKSESDGGDDYFFDDPLDLLDLEYTTGVEQATEKEARKSKRKAQEKSKAQAAAEAEQNSDTEAPVPPKRKRGRPRKDDTTPRAPKPPKKPKEDDGTPKRRRRRRGEAPKDFRCHLCGKEAKNNWNLQVHIRGVHEGFRNYQCATCKKYYSNKTILLNHVRSAHDLESNQFSCTEPGCEKSFAYAAGLRIHQMRHTGEMKFECDVCHKKFRRGCDLVGHQRKHTSERPFICEQCGCGFKSNPNLIKHRLIHDGEARFQGKPVPTCSLCGKTFLWEWNLRVHIRTVHEKITPFKCPLCEKAFPSSSNLNVHLHGFHKCLKDDNNKIVLPTHPISNNDGGAWSNDDNTLNSNPPPEEVNRASSSNKPSSSVSEIHNRIPMPAHSQYQAQISQEVHHQPLIPPTPSTIPQSFPYGLASYYNYTL